MITKRELVVGLLAGFVGSVIGMSVNTASVAEEVAQGEVLRVCINKKTGAIKVAKKCPKGERKTTLGGVGPQGVQGEKGDVGAVGPVGPQGPKGDIGPLGEQGIQGVQGPLGPQGPKGDIGSQGIQGPIGLQGRQGDRGLTGLTGATGQVTGLRTRSITVWEQSYFGSSCNSFLGFSVLNSGTSLSTGFGGTISLRQSCSTLYPSTVTVYAP
jgi:hypothetical protein